MDIEIRKINKLKDNFLRINLALNTTDFGTIVIKGFRVGKSPKFNGIWIQPPSFNVYGKYHEMCFFENDSIWKNLEAFLSDAYTNYEEQHPEEFIDFDQIAREIGGDAYK